MIHYDNQKDSDLAFDPRNIYHVHVRRLDWNMYSYATEQNRAFAPEKPN